MGDGVDKKISISVLGCCVSRDTAARDIFNVGRYAGLISPYSMLSGKAYELSADDVRKGGISGVFARSTHLDAANSVIKYLSEVKSDWLLFDICAARRAILKWHDKELILTNNFFQSAHYSHILKLLGEPDEEINALDIPFTVMAERMERVCDEVLALYKPGRIILHKAYGVNDYLTKDGKLKKFSDDKIAENVKRRILLEKLNNICENKFKGCHIIEMPDGVFADEMHRWGIQPLHFFGPYYDYAAEAIQIIDKRKNADEERAEIAALRKSYSEKFAMWRGMAESGNSLPLLNLREQCFAKIVPIKSESEKISVSILGSDVNAEIVGRNENKYRVVCTERLPSENDLPCEINSHDDCRSALLIFDVFDIWKHVSAEEEIIAYSEKLCDEILKIYPPEKIIFNEFYCAVEYMTADKTFRTFSQRSIEESDRINGIIKLANRVCEKKLAGCHIIKMPEHTFADENNRQGLSPSGYNSHYYSYAGKCISVIAAALPRAEENRRLEELFELYSERMLSNVMWARKNGYRKQREELKAKAENLLAQNKELKEKISALEKHRLGLEGEIVKLKEQNAEILTKAEMLAQQNTGLETRLTVQKLKLQEEQAEKKAVQKELSDIRASHSYKLGRAATYLPRKLRDALKRK